MGLFDSYFGGDRPWYSQDDGMLPLNILRSLYKSADIGFGGPPPPANADASRPWYLQDNGMAPFDAFRPDPNAIPKPMFADFGRSSTAVTPADARDALRNSVAPFNGYSPVSPIPARDALRGSVEPFSRPTLPSGGTAPVIARDAPPYGGLDGQPIPAAPAARPALPDYSGVDLPSWATTPTDWRGNPTDRNLTTRKKDNEEFIKALKEQPADMPGTGIEPDRAYDPVWGPTARNAPTDFYGSFGREHLFGNPVFAQGTSPAFGFNGVPSAVPAAPPAPPPPAPPGSANSLPASDVLAAAGIQPPAPPAFDPSTQPNVASGQGGAFTAQAGTQLPPQAQSTQVAAAPGPAPANTPPGAAPPPAAPPIPRTAQAGVGGGGAGAPPGAPDTSVYQALGEKPGLGGLGAFAGGGGLLGILGDLTAGSPRQQQLAQMQAVFQAVRGQYESQGYSRNEASRRAMMVALNSTAQQTAFPEMLGNPYEKSVLNNEWGGQDVTYTRKPQGPGDVAAAPGAAVQGAGGAGASVPQSGPFAGQAMPRVADIRTNIAAMKAKGATKEQLIAALPDGIRNYVAALMQGKALPSNLGIKSQARANLEMMAHDIDETMDEGRLAALPAAYKSWTEGKDAGVVRRVGQASLHFGDLVNDQMAALPGHQVPAANRAANFFNSEVLGKAAANNFHINATALASELAGIWKEGNLSDHAIEEWGKGLKPDMSVEQQRGAARTLVRLYKDGVHELEVKRANALPYSAGSLPPILDPEAQRALAQIEAFANGGKTAPVSKDKTYGQAAKDGWNYLGSR